MLNSISYDGKQYIDQDIEDATGYRKSIIVEDELPYDTFEAEVWDYANALLMLADSGPNIAMQNADGRFMLARLSNAKMTDYTYGAPVTWSHRGKIVLKQFLESVRRTGNCKYLLSCVSGIGLIEKSRHYGGLYSGEAFSSVLADIIGGAFPYTVDNDVVAITVYGWLPVDNRRNNLRKLLVSSGVIIKANLDGSVRFSVPDITSPAQIPDQSIYMSGSIEHPTKYQAVKITEHTYAKTHNDILTTLLDGAAVAESIITPSGESVSGTLIVFDNPMHDLSITGTTIIESGVNYAVLAPSSYCTLTGYKYSHMTRIVTAGALTAAEQATKRLDDCTLVNTLNVDAVAQRWLEYFSSQKIITLTEVWNGEQPGDAVRLSDPYDDDAIGLVEEQSIRLSAKLAGDTTIQAGKIPSAIGNMYSHVTVITQSGEVTIPAGTNGKVMFVLISGGQGGSSGYPGEAAAGTQKSEQKNSGDATIKDRYAIPPASSKGGDAGEPGGGARILQVTLSVAAEQKFSCTIGKGGAGGLFSAGPNTPGSLGGETTVGSYTTAGVQETEVGYYDPINAVLYGAPGAAGISGGNGGGAELDTTGPEVIVPAESVTGFGQTFAGGTSLGIESVQNKSKGSVGNGLYGSLTAYGFGSYGGGAAYGAPGGNGTADGITLIVDEYGVATAKGAHGGAGANASKPPKPTNAGTGGYGGNGGGGAGAGGPARVRNAYYSSDTPASNFTATLGDMTAGNGSDGGDGADGVLLMYW